MYDNLVVCSCFNKKFNFDKFIVIFLCLQPFLDITSGILLHFGYSITISSIIRLAYMMLCILYLIFVVKNNKINKYLFFIFIYFILYVITVLVTKSSIILVSEIKNFLTTFYFSINLLTFTEIYHKRTFNTKILSMLYLIFLTLILIPNLLNLGFNSYSDSKTGSTGWFYSANTVGSILSILLPFTIINIKKINLNIILLAIINLYTIFNIGTKTPVLSFFIVIFVNAIYFIFYLVKKYNYKKLIIPLFSSFVIFVIGFSLLVIPKTSFYKNLVIHINFLEKQNNGNINLSHFVDHFIFSERLSFAKKTQNFYCKSSYLEKLFGIGYMKKNISNKPFYKTIEIDYFDVFYRHGLIGFLLFFLPVLYVIVELIKKCKNVYTDQKKLNIFISILLIFSLALFQGHIFVTPQISIYAALILSLSYNNSFNYN